MTAAELCGNNQGLVKMFNPSLMAPQPGAGKPVKRDATRCHHANQAPACSRPSRLPTWRRTALKTSRSYQPTTRRCRRGSSRSNGAQAAGRSACPGEFAGVCGAERGRVVRLRHEPAGRGRHARRARSFDMATSAVASSACSRPGQGAARGGRRLRRERERTTTGAVLDGGAIATFGGHRGRPRALRRAAAGALSGGAVVGQEVKKEAKNWGHLFLRVKPDALDDTTRRPPAVCGQVKDAGARVPGDRSAAEAAAALKPMLPIPTKIWESITPTASRPAYKAPSPCSSHRTPTATPATRRTRHHYLS